MFFVNIGPNSGRQRENGANQKICQTSVSIILCFHLSLLRSTLPRLHTSKTRSTAHLIHAISSKHSTLSSVLRRHYSVTEALWIAKADCWGSSGIGSWTPPLLHIHYITESHHTSTWYLLPLLYWWHSSISHFDQMTQQYSARISGCRADISAWMKEHHLQLNLAKTELLVFPATPTLQHDFTIQIDSLTITPSSLVRNLRVIFDDQLTFKDHTAKTARSCRFALHNIRKIRPFLTQHAAQLLVQALVISRLDYSNALLAGLPSCTIKPLQMILKAAARLVFSEPKSARHTSLCLPALAPGCSSHQVQDTDACI